MSTTARYWVGAVLVWVAWLPMLASAQTLAELHSAHRIQVRSELIPATGIVPGQQVELVIEIATDRWFTGGTRLEIPEVAGLVILQTNEFATNASDNRGGHSWVIQRWSLEVYPQRSGDFTIPPMTVKLRINDGGTGSIEGQLQSSQLQFSASRPASLASAEHWVAAPSFNVSQSFDRDPNGLRVGDAIEREIVFEATDVMAMMLPSFEAVQITGLKAYPEPPVLSNRSNRGELTARRTERISYVVEQEGRYLLPAQDYFWWDTRSAKLQLLSLPTVEILVGPAVAGAEQSKPDLSIDPRQLLGVLMALFGLAAILALGYKILPRIPTARMNATLKRGWVLLTELRKPALPDRLNPNGADSKPR